MSAATGSCGCFTGIGLRTPDGIYNLPGLLAIAYRTGTHASFKKSMLANLSILSQLPSQGGAGALSELLTRDDGDFAIGLLDAWATVADILTFYQERIANENYLRTATELRSVLQLAREIGYELNPGVAAGTVLAFTIDEAASAPQTSSGQAPQPGTTALSSSIVIANGTKVQSVPDPGQQPVTFETTSPIAARPEWNQLRPAQKSAQIFAGTPTSVVFTGVATNLKVGDGVVTLAGTEAAFGIVTKVTPVPDQKDPSRPGTTVVALAGLADGSHRKHAETWPLPSPPPPNPFPSDVFGKSLSEDALQAKATQHGFAVHDLLAYLGEAAITSNRAFVFRTRAAVFGHNAPVIVTPSNPLLPQIFAMAKAGAGSKATKQVQGQLIVKAADSAPNKVSLLTYWHDTFARPSTEAGALLDNVYPDFSRGSSVVLRSGDDWGWYGVAAAEDTSWADFNISAKVTAITFDATSGTDLFSIVATSIYGGSDLLTLADLPDESVVTGSTVMLDRWIEGLKVGQQVVVEGDSADVPGTRIVETPALLAVDHVLKPGGGTLLTLSPGLSHSYVRSSVTINANAGAATHGETVNEFVGSGDATQPFQSFKLRQPPLTYTSSATSSGGTSSLELWVNDVRWKEVSSLIDSGPKDRVYVVRLDENHVPTVRGGDGMTGARFPTGLENLRAVYRKGTGLDGEVRAGQLTLLSNRPLGVKGVTNPVPAGGAQDVEGLSDARSNASVSVLTLGRVVSLLDYQNFARAFSGIGKAVAAWSHLGETRGVVVTVAGSGGEVLDPNGQTCTYLLSALQDAGEPYVPIRVLPHQPVTFQLELSIDVDGDHDKAIVSAAAVAELRRAFSFSARGFGQAVAVSEVIAIVQAIEGVVAVQVQNFARTGGSAAVNGVLTAALSAGGGDIQKVKGAELLTLDPAPVPVGTF
jgi:predicted phage baseplate assembly protein